MSLDLLFNARVAMLDNAAAITGRESPAASPAAANAEAPLLSATPTPLSATTVAADDAALSEQTSELERSLFPEAAHVDYNFSLTDLSESVTSVISAAAVKFRAGTPGK